MKRQRLSFSAQQLRQLGVFMGLCLSGIALAWWWFPLDTAALDALRQEVEQLQSRVQGQPAPEARALHPQATAVPDDPLLNESDMFWPWLQQQMQAQGLQVLALRPQAAATDKGLPQQPVALRLQGRWRDWLAFEKALHEHAPWWVIDQWQVLPAAAHSGEVRIELQARLGLRPPAWVTSPAQRVWPQWPLSAPSLFAAADPLFGVLNTSAPLAPAPEAKAQGPTDPRGWGADQLRLLGVWRQEGAAHAVLGAGQDQVTLKLGQRIGREAYRVRRIGHDHVELAASGASSPALHLTLQEGKR